MGWRGWDQCTGGDPDPVSYVHSSCTLTGGEEEIHGRRCQLVGGDSFLSICFLSEIRTQGRCLRWRREEEVLNV